MHNVYAIKRPKNPLPIIFDSPHSGSEYPKDFEHAHTLDDLRKVEDNYVDDLFAAAPQYGVSLLEALFPRSYIDVNRAVDDIDPAVLSEDWPYGELNPTARSDAGIGLIRRLLRPGVPLHKRELTPQEVSRRIEHYYAPYHKALKELLDEAHYNFGQVWHINCHSMPAASAVPKQPAALTTGGEPKPVDFVLGDRSGTTCAIDFTHMIRDFLRGLGYSVTINDPFKGVELVRAYSSPTRGRHSLQLEINKALYMNEDTLEKTKNYAALKADLEKLTQMIAEHVSAQLIDKAAD